MYTRCANKSRGVRGFICILKLFRFIYETHSCWFTVFIWYIKLHTDTTYHSTGIETCTELYLQNILWIVVLLLPSTVMKRITDGVDCLNITQDHPEHNITPHHPEHIIRTYHPKDNITPHHPEHNIFQEDEDGDTILHIAVMRKDVKMCEWLAGLACGSCLLNLTNYVAQTPLHLAVIVRDVHIVRLLLAAGASSDVRDSNGNTPLHAACRDGHHEIVETLLSSDTFSRKVNAPELETRNYDGQTCLHLAARSSYIYIIHHLLHNGADINSRDRKSGRSILHYAAETGNRTLVEYLLQQQRLDVNCVTYGGSSALFLAHGRGFVEIVDMLKNHGAFWEDVEDMDSD